MRIAVEFERTDAEPKWYDMQQINMPFTWFSALLAYIAILKPAKQFPKIVYKQSIPMWSMPAVK